MDSTAQFRTIPSLVPQQIAPDTQQKVPRMIFQTMETSYVPQRMYDHVSQLWKMNPDYEYRFYDNQARQKFIQDSYGKQSEVAQAFSKINLGVIKADFWRYAVLYKYGGVYIDLDASFKQPLSSIIQPEDDYLTGIGQRGDPHQWVIICSAGNLAIGLALQDSTRRILKNEPLQDKRYRWHRVASMAGPPILNLALKQHLNQVEQRLEPGTICCEGRNYRILEGDFLGGMANFKYDGYQEDLEAMRIGYWKDKN